MADVVFLVHGMGHHPANWHADAETKLRELYARYTRLSRIPFDERFRIVPIQYDDVFRRLVRDWQQNAAALGPVADNLGAAAVENLVGWLRNASTADNNFVWTHAADVLMYRLFFSVRQEIKTSVAGAIAREIDALPASASWSIIAHSLGSAVVHDSLDMLWTGRKEDGTPTGFQPRQEQALLVAMISNVCRVLQTNPKAYDGTVKPGRAGQKGRGCLNYLSCRHKLDPFCIPKMFRPNEWPDPDSAERGVYRYVEIDHIHQVNVHDFNHYLDNPNVHIPLFRKLSFKSAITTEEENNAIAGFAGFGNLGEAIGIRIKQRIEETVPGLPETWNGYRTIWDQFEAVINEF